MATGSAGEHVFPPRALARVLGVQYTLGGTIALVWNSLPVGGPAAGRPVIAALGILASALGLTMVGLASAPLTAAALDRISHACILSAQAVVAFGYAATQDPGSPIVLFLLWTTPYAGIFTRAGRWGHVATTAALLGAASLAMPAGRDAAVAFVFVMATVLVATLLVSRMTDRLHHAATHDALTGLPNRSLFAQRTQAALDRCGHSGGRVLVALIDLDRFKTINDSYGHAVGDALLQHLAPRLVRAVPEGVVVARLGGDEFAVLWEDPSGAGDADDVLAGLCSAWTEPVVVGDRRLHVGGSTGVAIAAPNDSPETLLRDADTAMYEAKAAGGNVVRLFDAGLTGRSRRLSAIEEGLREAAARGELALHYQPVMALHDDRPIGAEGLLRWTSGELGSVRPDEFIDVAERSGLIGGLGTWVLDRALADLAGWRASGLVDASFQVAVNVSAHQLVEQLPFDVSTLLARHGIPAANLGLEITESAMMTGETPDVVLGRLHDLGVTLLLDDFGTGFSSLSHLRRFPLDVIKIDRSFVDGMCRDGQDRALVLGALSLAKALGRTVVAEGIETGQQLAELRAAGCDAGQGYWLSRPVPAERLAEALASAQAAGREASARPVALHLEVDGPERRAS